MSHHKTFALTELARIRQLTERQSCSYSSLVAQKWTRLYFEIISEYIIPKGKCELVKKSDRRKVTAQSAFTIEMAIDDEQGHPSQLSPTRQACARCRIFRVHSSRYVTSALLLGFWD